MLKNVSLRPRTINGRATWLLLGPDGQPVPAFSAFTYALRNAKKNTLDSYCSHLAQFLDYLIEAATLHGGQLTRLQLTEAIEAYGEFLQLGMDARSDVARNVAKRLNPRRNVHTSIGPKKAAIRRFLRLSEDVRKEMAELAQMKAHLGTPVDGSPLLPGLASRRELQPFEVHAMQANSMLAGVIAGGPRFIDCVVLDAGSEDVSYDQNRAFPYDKVMELIDAMPTYREKALYSLLAASGCRTHEALQLLFEDIDVLNGTIRLIDPATRIGHASYRALSYEERALLAWKGRTTQFTLLIEPFASKFFESLKKYLDTEYTAHGRHDFIFQYIKGNRRGKPFFLSADNSRLEIFDKACVQVGVVLPKGTRGHSLRHTYGTYLLNYFPRANGDYGLPAPLVQQMMGHAGLKDTLKYARYDNDLLKLEIENANRVLFKNGTPKRVMEPKVEALESQLAKLRAELHEEAIAHG